LLHSHINTLLVCYATHYYQYFLGYWCHYSLEANIIG